MMDNGYPQASEFKILKDFIKTESHELTLEQKKDEKIANSVTVLASTVPWRPPNIKYKKNEVFLDVIEKLNMVISQNGSVIKSEIIGQLKANCMLTGMPELKLGVNDKQFFEAQNR